MDPLTCLSVAGTVVQFVDFTFKILSGTRQLYENGQLSGHEQIGRATKDLENFSTKMSQAMRLQGTVREMTDTELELENTCRECAALAKDLTLRLDAFKSSPKRRTFENLGLVFKSICSKKELDEMEKKLSRFRDVMNCRLLGVLGERVEQVLEAQGQQTQTINENTRQVIATALLDIHASLTRDLDAQTKKLASVLSSVQPSVSTDLKLFQLLPTIVVTEKEEQLYLDIEQEEARLHNRIADDILDSLRYPDITERYERVTETHQKTFEWILKPKETNDTIQWSDFAQWLREGDGLYWISGKPGAGKSTIMKFINESPQTRQHLLRWANGTPLLMPSFFFWWGGSRLQQSQEGLFRTLLESTLREMPELIPYVLPTEWAKQYASRVNLGPKNPIGPWSLPVLLRGFRSLVSQKEVPMKLCIFIDGLDEYDGLEIEIARVFNAEFLSPNIKVCVSSRAHIPFQDAFVDWPKLRVHDLTHRDIQRFITEKLAQDELMKKLSKEEPQACQELVDEIDQAAEGVFLWVDLVIKSLLFGLGNRDRIKDLRKRLRALPPGLDAFYEHTIMKIDPVYQEEASKMYQLVGAAIPTEQDWNPPSPLSLLTMFVAMELHSLREAELRSILENDALVLSKCKETELLLRTRCRGLLEVRDDAKRTEILPTMEVSYCHRTVRDFLQKHNTRLELLKRTPGTKTVAFNPNIVIYKSLQLQIRDGIITPVLLRGIPTTKPIEDLITYALRLDRDNEIPTKELATILKDFPVQTYQAWSLPFATQFGLTRYLHYRLSHGSSTTKTTTHAPLLHYALNDFTSSDPSTKTEILTTLFSFGANINEKSGGGKTHWQELMEDLIANRETPWGGIKDSCGYLPDIISVLLKNGADIQAPLKSPRKPPPLRGATRVDDHGGKNETGQCVWTVPQVLEGQLGIGVRAEEFLASYCLKSRKSRYLVGELESLYKRLRRNKLAR